LAATGVAALAAAPLGGVWVGAWIGLALPLSAWVVLERPPLPVLPNLHPATIPPVAALAAVAAWQGRGVFDRHVPVALILVSYAVAIIGSRHHSALQRLTKGVGHVAGTVASRVVFLVLGLGVVVAPWTVQRLAVVDPLATGADRGSGWMRRQRPSSRAGQPWTEGGLVTPPRRFRRMRLTLASVVLVAVAGGAVVMLGRDTEPNATSDAPRDLAAFDDSPWWPDYYAAMQWAFLEPGLAYNPLRYPRMREVHTPYINIEDGERRTWTPPPCDCRRVQVWMYGASALLGMGQRDDHTIPSELARLAAADGIVLDVWNHGVLGDLHWEEAQRFAWDVEAEEPPDLVVFYSGSNDMAGTEYRDGLGHGLDGTPVDWTAEDALRLVERLGDQLQFLSTPSRKDEKWTAPALPKRDKLPPDELGAFVARQYRRAREMARHTAAAHGVAAQWFWQPSLYLRPPVPSEPHHGPQKDRYQRAAFAAATAGLPSGVHDLSHVYDDSSEPYFFDDVHTNEEGALLVARAMYQQMRGELHRLAAG
jgi:lysophospholipase L1-like esterase